jgi:hypothetical protein
MPDKGKTDLKGNKFFAAFLVYDLKTKSGLNYGQSKRVFK